MNDKTLSSMKEFIKGFILDDNEILFDEHIGIKDIITKLYNGNVINFLKDIMEILRGQNISLELKVEIKISIDNREFSLNTLNRSLRLNESCPESFSMKMLTCVVIDAIDATRGDYEEKGSETYVRLYDGGGNKVAEMSVEGILGCPRLSYPVCQENQENQEVCEFQLDWCNLRLDDKRKIPCNGGEVNVEIKVEPIGIKLNWRSTHW